MKGGTRAALKLGAVILLPTVAGLVLLGWVIDKAARAIDEAGLSLEDAVTLELAR